MSVQRPAWIEIDLSALRHNAQLLRQIAGDNTTLYAVVKGDAYGVGIPAVVEALRDSKIHAFAAGDFDEAIEVRRCSTDATILLYGSYVPEQIAELATHEIVLTVYSPECLGALAKVDRPLAILVKVDCGFGRLGFREDEMEPVLRTIQGLPRIQLKGLYTHVGAVDDPAAVSIQANRFTDAQRCAERLGFSGLEYMIASSRILLGYPGLRSNAVNPGRLLYGLLESPWRDRTDVRPVFKAVKSRLLQIKRLVEGRRYGYGPSVEEAPSGARVGIAAIGFASGLPRSMGGAEVLVLGRRARVIGLAAMEHLLLDLTGIDSAAVGDEVVLIGKQGNDAISGEAFSQQLGMTELELLPRLGRGLRRCYS